MAHLPLLGSVLWQRSVLLRVFGLSIVGGFGMDALTKASLRRPVIRWSFGGVGVAASGLLALWLFGRGDLPAAESSIRAGSFAWPAAEVVVGLVVLGGIVLMERRDRARHRLARQPDERPIWGAAVILLICSTGFLLAAGMPIWTSASAPFTPTPAVRALKDIVGSSVVGFGASLCFFPPGLGILPNAQSAYGIQELGLYDPMIPKRYFTAWTSLTGRSAGDENDSAYCPVITTSRQARLYGVGYVVEQAHAPGPVGSVLAGTVGGEEIFRIPGSSSASLVPSNQPAIIGASEIGARPVRVMHPDPTTWRLSTRAPGAERLILRLTDVPGWHATIDGRTATLNRFAGVMMELEVPPGGHEIQVTYWPESFAVGIVIAMVTALAMLVIGGIGWYRVRKQTFE
jgi:hypothetical protein